MMTLYCIILKILRKRIENNNVMLLLILPSAGPFMQAPPVQSTVNPCQQILQVKRPCSNIHCEHKSFPKALFFSMGVMLFVLITCPVARGQYILVPLSLWSTTLGGMVGSFSQKKQ